MFGTRGSHVPSQGLSGLLKEGSKHISGVDEAVLRNIDACKQLSSIVRTSIGPNGMNKMVVNHLGRIFVTSDAATIVRELEVIHPAARLVVLASTTQEREVGDGTCLVVVFAGELLEQAEKLLRQGLHTTEIIQGKFHVSPSYCLSSFQTTACVHLRPLTFLISISWPCSRVVLVGYERALEKALKVLESITVYKVADAKNVSSVKDALKTCLASKQYGMEGVLAPLIAEACVNVLPSNINMFSVENVRVAKVLGGNLADSSVVSGAVLVRDVEGTISKVSNARVAVYTCDFEAAQSETKGTVLLKSADEFTSYTKSEETMLEGKIKSLSDAGITVVVATKFGDVAMHFIEKYRMMAIRCQSKFDLRRVARTTGAIALAKMIVPTTDETGRADTVEVEEVGSTKCIVFRQQKEGSRISTILVRSSTQNQLDDVDRAVDDAVNVYKGITKDPRFVAGAGAAEAEMSRQVHEFADSRPGLEQYGIKAFADALLVVPRMLGQNAGTHETETVSTLVASHATGSVNAGVNVDDGTLIDALDDRIFDQTMCKYWALKLATEAVTTILAIDQLIVSKTAGGPKPRDMQSADTGDDMMA
jgi:T-complex protein 1 subunit theta